VETKREQLLVLFLALSFIALSPLAFSGLTVIDIGTGITFYNNATSGNITFGSPFTCTQITWITQYLRLSNLVMGGTWGAIGFQSPTNGGMQLTQLQTNQLKFSTQPSGAQTFRVYAGARGTPTSVVGGDSWSWDAVNQAVLVVSSSPETVQLGWGSLPSIHITPNVGLIDSWLQTGDLSGFIIAVFTSELGQMFWVMILLIISVPMYMTMGAIPTGIMWTLFWGTFEISQPAIALDFGLIMLGLSVGFLIFSLYLGRRSIG
jgi:hypothetical protein